MSEYLIKDPFRATLFENRNKTKLAKILIIWDQIYA